MAEGKIRKSLCDRALKRTPYQAKMKGSAGG